MPDRLEVEFAPTSAALSPTTAVLAGPELRLGRLARALDERSEGAIARAADAAEFKAKRKTSLELLAPARLDCRRLLVVGTGPAGELEEGDWINLGGYIYAQIAGRKTPAASIVAEPPEATDTKPAEIAAAIAFGALLRSYNFRKYLKRKSEAGNGAANGNDAPDEPPRDALRKLIVHTAEPAAARAAFERRQAVAAGVFLARDLINEPANVLGPVEFAERTRELAEYGVEVEVLDADQLREIGMEAVLAVNQGSASSRPARVVVMQWHGAKSRRSKPLCFVGKGVVFDTGGISMKPASGMEEMKGDMAGAACVTGLMRALGGRRAAVNAVGLIGLVENMNSATAQRPGDIIGSLSGQTIEVLNTDAEGRLVLGDVLWYAQERFKPRLIIDLATLTGAIIVALGKEYAGLFANDDKLAAEITAAGKATGERVWRMPLDRAYDKMLESRNADMKNIGGRHGGAITAAQFLQRFIKGTPWAHIDIAGVAMDSVKNDINQGWASGWGVRLLDRLVADGHEKPG